MPDTLDHRIKELVVELVESSRPPKPFPAPSASSRRVRTGLGWREGLLRMLLAAVAVLTVGVIGALAGRSLWPPDDLSPEPGVVAGDPSPPPQFSTTDLGSEIRLLPPTGEVSPIVDRDTVDGDVVAVGRIEGTEIELFRWDTKEPTGTCLQVVGPNARDTRCSSEVQSGNSSRPPWVIAQADPTSGEPSEVVAVWVVHEHTSVVSAEHRGTQIWQRPVAALVAFTFEVDESLVTMWAVDVSGETMVGTGFSPAGQ